MLTTQGKWYASTSRTLHKDATVCTAVTILYALWFIKNHRIKTVESYHAKSMT